MDIKKPHSLTRPRTFGVTAVALATLILALTLTQPGSPRSTGADTPPAVSVESDGAADIAGQATTTTTADGPSAPTEPTTTEPESAPAPSPDPGAPDAPGADPAPGESDGTLEAPEPTRRVSIPYLVVGSGLNCYEDFETRYFDGNVGILIETGPDFTDYVGGGPVGRMPMTRDNPNTDDLLDLSSTEAELGDGPFEVTVQVGGFVSGAIQFSSAMSFDAVTTNRFQEFTSPDGRCTINVQWAIQVVNL